MASSNHRKSVRPAVHANGRPKLLARPWRLPDEEDPAHLTGGMHPRARSSSGAAGVELVVQGGGACRVLDEGAGDMDAFPFSPYIPAFGTRNRRRGVSFGTR